MYCPVVLPTFLQYLANAEYLISSSSIALQVTLKIPNKYQKILHPWLDAGTFNNICNCIDPLLSHS